MNWEFHPHFQQLNIGLLVYIILANSSSSDVFPSLGEMIESAMFLVMYL